MLINMTKIKMINILKNRELVFLSPRIKVRGLMANHTKYLDKHFSRYRIDKDDVDIYYSLARLKKMPYMSYNPIERKKQMAELDEAYNHIYSYDMGWDFDNFDKSYKGFLKAKKEVKKVMAFFDEYKIKYTIRFSGSGFHLVVPDIQEGFVCSPPEFMGYLENIAKKVRDILELETLDLSVYDIRRIWRLPFTINTKTNKVAVPLNKRQFTDFNFDDYSIEVFKENQPNYSEHWYNHDLTEKEINNKKLFVKDLGDYHGKD